MLYIVNGHARSGTTMMMRALQAGGMNVCCDIPEVMELGDRDVSDLGFAASNNGKLVKLVWTQSLGLWYHHGIGPVYKIVFIRRDPDAIRRSCLTKYGEVPEGVEDYSLKCSTLITHLGKRADIELSVVDYEFVCRAPFHEFRGLKRAGWPIDPVKASEIVARKEALDGVTC